MVSLFCRIMKGKEKTSKLGESNGNQKEGSKESTNLQGLKSSISNYANDIAFLLFKLVGYIPAHYFRMFLYKHVFMMDIAKDVVIYYGLEARSPWNISIGKGSIVGDHAILDARHGITIGENVNLSTCVWIWTLQHDVNDPNFGTAGNGKAVVIGNRAWISSRSTILPGCFISEGCVIAAGAVVTKSCSPEFGIYGGIPAKRIGERNNNIHYCFDGRHRHFI